MKIQKIHENNYTIHFHNGKQINIKQDLAVEIMKQKANDTKMIIVKIDNMPYSFSSSSISMIIPREYTRYEKEDMRNAGLEYHKTLLLDYK